VPDLTSDHRGHKMVLPVDFQYFREQEIIAQTRLLKEVRMI
jgi:hypothetical protein